MSSLTLLSESTSKRPLCLRFRPDLTMGTQTSYRSQTWVVHDSIALRSYQLGRREKFILECLDGRASLEDVQHRYENEFTPERLDLRELQSFIATAHREGLLLSSAAGQGIQLLNRRDDLRSRQRRSRISNVLALRCPGFNPSKLLTKLERRTRWVFTRAFLAIVTLTVVCGIFVFIQSAVRGDLPVLESLLTWRTAFSVLFAIGAAKIIHELAHGVTCVHFGGKCHEMGIMLLIFCPCLYCDVSSSVLFSNKWKRIAVASAGIISELAVAAVCILIWRFSEPGAIHELSFSVALVCSVNTLLINGNPLLRFDGYYILADLLDLPNLQSQSSQHVRRMWSRLFISDRPVVGDRLSTVPGYVLTTYATLAFLYRLAILTGIVWMAYVILQPLGAVWLAHLLTASVIFNFAVRPRTMWLGYITDPGLRHRVRWRRFVSSQLAIAAALAVLLFVPWPQRLMVDATLQPHGAEIVYVTVPGTLVSSAGAGQPVREGEPVAQLASLELELEVARLRSQFRQQEQRVNDLMRTQGGSSRSGDELPAARIALDELQARLNDRLDDVQQLTLRAPNAGIVIPIPINRPPEGLDELDRIEGVPTDDRNLGQSLDVGMPICQVGNASRHEAIAVIPAEEVGRVTAGQHVELRFPELPGTRIVGRIQRVSAIDATSEPYDVESPARLRSDTDLTSNAVREAYEARIEWDHAHPVLRFGSKGRAYITVRSDSWVHRAWRFLRTNFALGI